MHTLQSFHLLQVQNRSHSPFYSRMRTQQSAGSARRLEEKLFRASTYDAGVRNQPGGRCGQPERS